MKSRFEEHDNQLFRMLEEPVPLTTDAKLPSLVRLIQDDTMLGKANKMSCHSDTIRRKIVCTELTDDGLFMQGNYSYRYEIIGYPVSDGSNEWALYQVMQGERVCHKKSPSIVYYKHAGGIRLEVRHNHIDYMSKDDCWQIYKEPEPQYKVGDWVEMDYKGTLYHRQVISVHDNGIRVEFGGATPLISFDGKSSMLLIRLVRKLKPNEVEVDFGFAKGRILSRTSGDVKVLNNKSVVIATIIVSEITNPATRELVEGLLEAQEEEE